MKKIRRKEREKLTNQEVSDDLTNFLGLLHSCGADGLKGGHRGAGAIIVHIKGKGMLGNHFAHLVSQVVVLDHGAHGLREFIYHLLR